MTVLQSSPETPVGLSTEETETTARLAELHTVLRIGRVRAGVEIRQLFRNRGGMVFTFALPIVMLTLLATIYRGQIPGTTVQYQEIYATGMLGMCVINACLQNLAYQVAQERHSKALKRLRTTPMPKASYFLGKVGMVLAATFAQAAAMLLVGVTLLGLELPTSPGRWLTFLWVLGLGIVACSLLGIGLSSLVRAEGAEAAIWLPIMVLQFISGVFILFSQLPKPLQEVASFFPIKWLCQGMRSVFLPDSFRVLEPAGSWEHGRTALVLIAWCVIGLALCLKTFQWKGRYDG